MLNGFRLDATYEIDLDSTRDPTRLRVEILVSTHDDRVFRAHVSILSAYNVYPSALNTGPKGDDLQKYHSSDEFLIDITKLLKNGEEMLRGFSCESTEDAVRFATKQASELLSVTTKIDQA